MTHATALAAARGFSALYWGLIVLALHLTGAIKILLPGLNRLPGHLFGLLILLAGLHHLRQVWPTPQRGRGWLCILGLAVFLQIYLVPFLGWWRAGTAAWYAALNLAVFIASGLVLVAAIPRLAVAWATQVQDAVLHTEARMCAWLVPVLGGVAITLYVMRMGHLVWLTDPAFALHHLLMESSHLTLLPALLPCIPALAIAWSCKESALRACLNPPPAAPE